MVLHLCSDAASFINGALFVIDGGADGALILGMWLGRDHIQFNRHCEERSDVAIQFQWSPVWIAALRSRVTAVVHFKAIRL